MNRITKITRKNIFEILTSGFEEEIPTFWEPIDFKPDHYSYNFWGKLTSVDFLNRLYPLKEFPSKDPQFKNAEEEIYAHTITNNDYPKNWLFTDERFPLKNGPDEDFLDFLCEIFHPNVRKDEANWLAFYYKINELLKNDKYRLFCKGQISGKDIFGWHDKTLLRLKETEISIFLRLFNRGGYVLNFTTPSFNEFTKRVVNVALCDHYNLSKGKSLELFIDDGTEDEIIKLFNELMEYYELQPEYDEEIHGQNYQTTLYKKCKEILNRINKETPVLPESTKNLKGIFSSEYLTSEIDLMCKMQKENPTEAIGKAKELIESCCKTILENYGINLDKNWDINHLMNETTSKLKIMPKDIPDNIPESTSMKTLLAALKTIVNCLANIRNAYGTGHGRSNSYKGLQERHAKLAVGSSVTLVNFLWDSFLRQNQK
ncbi:MAG: abortive infection family protein [Prevotella sp.]|jgi:hypothetical protein|nr:abortive infection family protein [Prevotella sp.]